MDPSKKRFENRREGLAGRMDDENRRVSTRIDSTRDIPKGANDELTPQRTCARLTRLRVSALWCQCPFRWHARARRRHETRLMTATPRLVAPRLGSSFYRTAIKYRELRDLSLRRNTIVDSIPLLVLCRFIPLDSQSHILQLRIDTCASQSLKNYYSFVTNERHSEKHQEVLLRSRKNLRGGI